MIKACVFDLDGTLLNTLPTIMHYCNQTLERYGLSPYTQEDYRSFVGNGARDLVTRMLKGRGADLSLLEDFLNDYLAAYDGEPHLHTVPYEGVPELLSLLRLRGCRLGIISNKPNSSVTLLVEHFFPSVFSVVSGTVGADPAQLKPATGRLSRILADWSCTSDECLFLGDGIPDMQLAANARVGLPIAALWGFTPSELLLPHGGIPAQSPLDVLGILEKHEG